MKEKLEALIAEAEAAGKDALADALRGALERTGVTAQSGGTGRPSPPPPPSPPSGGG